MNDVLDPLYAATTAALPFAIPPNRWSEHEAAGKSPAELLLYRSNLLGADLTVTNFGGGNTSAKLEERDPLTRAKTTVLWVKGSKNGIAAAVNASAYASAKAAALHLARCLALEGAPHGIRVNTVNPDAVIKGSRIWDGAWRQERAGAYGIDAGAALEVHYRDRSMLKREVLPSDIANAVYFFASELSAKSTGNMLNVDAGNAQAFTR